MVEQHYANVGSADWDADDALFSADVETVDPGAGTLRGLAAFKGYEQAFHGAFPDGRLVLRAAYERGSTIVVEGAFIGSHTGPLVSPSGQIPPTGRRLELPFCDIFQEREGKFVTHHIYYDQMAFMAQLGLLSAPAGASGHA